MVVLVAVVAVVAVLAAAASVEAAPAPVAAAVAVVVVAAVVAAESALVVAATGGWVSLVLGSPTLMALRTAIKPSNEDTQYCRHVRVCINVPSSLSTVSTAGASHPSSAMKQVEQAVTSRYSRTVQLGSLLGRSTGVS